MVVGCEGVWKYCVSQATQIFCSEVSYVLKQYRGKCYYKKAETLHTILSTVACKYDISVDRASHNVLHNYVFAAFVSVCLQ